GQACSAGPTALKLFGDGALIGQGFLDVFEIKRPHEVRTLDALRAKAGAKLHLQLRSAPFREVKGVLIDGPTADLTVIDLSFGISVVDAVRDYDLTAADFAVTDLAVELLYLVEAKSAAMDASQQLNQRLQGARVVAEEQALTDALTGLKNRRGMNQILRDLISHGENFALMQLDLDHFKAVNDTTGHAAGDYVLQQVARIMLNEVRGHDIVTRAGGDEFVLILRDVEEERIIEGIASRIIERLSEPLFFQGERCDVSGSAGTTLSVNYPLPSPDQLLKDADVALYVSKHEGRGQHTFFSDQLRAKWQAGIEKRNFGMVRTP
ncbi:MAG: GGDEF domain-containing protein, partial [Paracoccaceae bacterium]